MAMTLLFARHVPIAAPAKSYELKRGVYRVRPARDEVDLMAAFRLRFRVFNLEMKEGLEGLIRPAMTSTSLIPFVTTSLSSTTLRRGRRHYRLQSGIVARGLVVITASANLTLRPTKRHEPASSNWASLHRPRSSLNGCFVPLVAGNCAIRASPWRPIPDRVLVSGACASLDSIRAASTYVPGALGRGCTKTLRSTTLTRKVGIFSLNGAGAAPVSG